MAEKKISAAERQARIQKRYADSELKLKKARAAAKKAKIDGDLALLDHIREQTMESLDWEDWDEIVSSQLPDNAETVLDALLMTGKCILDERRAEAERKKAEADQKRGVMKSDEISDEYEESDDGFR